MESFATPAEMAERSQGAIAATHPFVQKELNAATAAIRNYCGWHIAGREQVEYRRNGPFSDAVWLPAMQIVTFDEGEINGATVDTDGVEFDSNTGWTNLCGRKVAVKFTAGFTTVPADLVTLTLELASGALASPLGVTREQAGGVSVTLARVSGALQVHPGGDDVARLAAYKLGRLP